jgi:hypothetical protein
MAEQPYKASHDLLVAGIGAATDYHADWRAIAAGMKTLVTASGFDPKGFKTPEDIRAKIKTATSEADVLRTGAAAPRTATGAAATAGHRRALALKTVRHLYYHASFGKQKVWILNLPTNLRNFPMEFEGEAVALVDEVLNKNSEKFDEAARKNLATACQTGLAWVEKAMTVCGAPLELANRKLFRRWFVPAGTKDEDSKITSWAATLRPSLQKIAAGLKTGEVILTDSPHVRGSGGKLENSEAFVFTNNDLIVVYIEQDFFGTKNTLTGATNWARIMVHELSHAYAKTKDHSYSWQGLLPRDDDSFKSANDAYVALNPQFPAVRALTFEQCKENADSWAFFIADCAGALSESDRVAALGTRLYDLGGRTIEDTLKGQLKNRAA